MNLQTQVNIPKFEGKLIDYTSKIFLLGSCFSQNIGDKLAYFKFDAVQNPFGILFHPLAIENLIEKAIQGYEFEEKDLGYLNEIWFSFDAHSALNAIDKEEIIRKLNRQVKITRKQIFEASHIFITLGTAWVYRYKKTQKIVANCHKVPQKEFTKELLSIGDINQSLQKCIRIIQQVNPKCEIVFTISPVRHIKNGMAENNRSKSHLLVAVNQVVASNKNTTYFPSYEIQIDELRDYRFYAEDMIHPNAIAIEYIWERFKTTYINATEFAILKEIDIIQKGLNHKPFHQNTKAHQEFLKSLSIRKQELQKSHPQIKF